MHRIFLLMATVFLLTMLAYPAFVLSEGKAPEIIRGSKKNPAGITPEPGAKSPGGAAAADSSLKQGVKALESGDYDRALKAFQQALAANPRSVEAYYYLGVVFDAKGDQEKAVKNLKAALHLDPNFPQARVALGQIYNQQGLSLIRQGKPEQAEAILKEAVTQDPKNDGAFNNLGVALGQQGNLTGSLTALQRAVALNPNNNGAQFNLGVLHYTLGDKNATVQQYTILTLTDPAAADELFRIIQGTSQVATPFRF